MKRRAVVTGLGVVTSLGRAVEGFWDRIVRGESGVGPISLFDVAGYRVQFGGQVHWEPENEGIANPKDLKRLDRFTQFAIASAKDAVADSGIDFSREEPCRCGVVIGSALRAIQYGDADVMVTGGSEAALTPIGLAGFQNMRALSFRGEAPQQASRPFDVDRDGFVLAEGAGVVVIEELEHARRRGARIYGELKGYGASGDAGHITQPDEEGRGAARAMEMALQDAGLAPDLVQYINAHGTSTPLGDKAETAAVKRVFGGHARKLAISSTKSQLGHTLGASGGIELVVCALTMARDVISPTINLDNPDPDCDLDYTPKVARQARVDVAMSNSFGFGGHNASLVLVRV